MFMALTGSTYGKRHRDRGGIQCRHQGDDGDSREGEIESPSWIEFFLSQFLSAFFPRRRHPRSHLWLRDIVLGLPLHCGPVKGLQFLKTERKEGQMVKALNANMILTSVDAKQRNQDVKEI